MLIQELVHMQEVTTLTMLSKISSMLLFRTITVTDLMTNMCPIWMQKSLTHLPSQPMRMQ